MPTLVLQCLDNPSWSHCDRGPPDTLVLYEFIRLRHRLLSLEDSSPVVSFASPTVVTELSSTSNMPLTEDHGGKIAPVGNSNGKHVILCVNLP